MLLAFLSALTFTGLEKYLILISKHDLLKRLWAFVYSHLICTVFIFSPDIVLGPGKQASLKICSTDFYVARRKGKTYRVVITRHQN